VIACSSSARPAAERPTRPLPRVPAWRAIASARWLGQPGNSRTTASASPSLERQVLVDAPLPVPFAAPSARVLVGKALRLGGLQGRLLHQEPLPLVALAGAGEADHHRRQAACLLGAAAR
jgi:hypothetical protein